MKVVEVKLTIPLGEDASAKRVAEVYNALEEIEKMFGELFGPVDMTATIATRRSKP